MSTDRNQKAIDEALGLLRGGNPGAAESVAAKIADQDPGDFDATRLRGIACHLQGRNEEAAGFLDIAVELRPNSAETHHNLGVVLSALARYEAAADSFERAIEINPDDPEVHNALGDAFVALKRYDDAIPAFRRAIEIQPDYAEAHNNLGVAHKTLNRWTEAVRNFKRAIELEPSSAEAHINLGGVLNQLSRCGEAVESLQQAIAIQSNSAEAHNNLGVALNKLKRYEEARDCFKRAVELYPHHDTAFSQSALVSRRICDWSDFSVTQAELTGRVRRDRSAVSPFVFLAFSEDPENHLLCAQKYANYRAFSGKRRPASAAPAKGERIRIAYVSGDFREHPVAYQMAGLFEQHDRDRFEITGISMGPDDKSPIRHRLAEAFDQFVDASAMSHESVAEVIAEKQVHIAVDLNGYTANARPEIFVQRPAPIQVNYLGYPCTMGVDFIDYIIVDPHIVPPDQQPNFSERLVHLPDSYLVTDSKRTVAKKCPSRRDAGLPENGFVFCCFHNSYKITPVNFDVWMRLLAAVPESVLWLRADTKIAIRNLRKEAAARNIDPDRIVLADRLEMADHLARHRLADLFLDTLPYNAHSSASDALWVGLPVLTCVGQAFAGRVAASLLHAVGLPELISNSLEDYEALALRLAANPDELSKLRQKLTRNRDIMPLFDTARFCRNIETAYEEMFNIWRSGKPPRPITVESTRQNSK